MSLYRRATASADLQIDSSRNTGSFYGNKSYNQWWGELTVTVNGTTYTIPVGTLNGGLATGLPINLILEDAIGHKAYECSYIKYRGTIPISLHSYVILTSGYYYCYLQEIDHTFTYKGGKSGTETETGYVFKDNNVLEEIDFSEGALFINSSGSHSGLDISFALAGDTSTSKECSDGIDHSRTIRHNFTKLRTVKLPKVFYESAPSASDINVSPYTEVVTLYIGSSTSYPTDSVVSAKVSMPLTCVYHDDRTTPRVQGNLYDGYLSLEYDGGN